MRVALVRLAQSLAAHSRATTSLEYALMGSLVAATIAASVFGYSGGLSNVMNNTFHTIGASL